MFTFLCVCVEQGFVSTQNSHSAHICKIFFLDHFEMYYFHKICNSPKRVLHACFFLKTKTH